MRLHTSPDGESNVWDVAQQLKATYQTLGALVECAPMAIYGMDLDGNITTWNDSACQIFGWTAEEVIGRKNPSAPVEDYEDIRHAVLTHGRVHGVEAKRIRKDGVVIDVSFWGAVLYSPEGQPVGTMAIASDITEHKQAVMAMQESEERFRTLVEHNPDAILIFAEESVRYANGAARKMFAAQSNQGLLGRSIYSFVHLDHLDIAKRRWAELDALRHATVQQSPQEYKLVRLSGEVFYADVSSMVIMDQGERCVLVIARDASWRKRTEVELRTLAYHDALTGLANRRKFREALEQALSEAHCTGFKVGVLLIDLDRFKYVNDSFGHAFGDELLKAMVSHILPCVRDSDVVARMGGDEFVVLLPNIQYEDQVENCARCLLEALARPLVVDAHQIHLSASIGIALSPGDGDDAETLLRYADAAMYQAKDAGGNQYQWTTLGITQRSLDRIEMENALRNAILQQEFVLHYQPQISLKTGQMVGVEALIRWERPCVGLVPPGAFIPIAEETGLILPITEWVLQEACRQNKRWLDAGIPNLYVSVNLSAERFLQLNPVQTIERILLETGLPSHLLEVEITESTIMTNATPVIRTLEKLMAMGVRIALDDFGTGYSSLGYLKRFRMNTLKIDKSFVEDLTTDAQSSAIVASIIALAHNLNMNVVAEGVETDAERAVLQVQGCDVAQGFLFERPVPADDIRLWFASLEVAAAGERPTYENASRDEV